MKFSPQLKLDVLDWVLEKHLAGVTPNDLDVAAQFNLTIEEAIELREQLTEQGEL